MPIADDDLEAVVAELASRPGHEKVRALLYRLLTDALGARSEQIAFERRIPEVNGRMDALLGRTVIEIKARPAPGGQAGRGQLTRYLPERERATGQRYVGLATDGATFIAYEMRDGALVRLTGARGQRREGPSPDRLARGRDRGPRLAPGRRATGSPTNSAAAAPPSPEPSACSNEPGTASPDIRRLSSSASSGPVISASSTARPSTTTRSGCSTPIWSSSPRRSPPARWGSGPVAIRSAVGPSLPRGRRPRRGGGRLLRLDPGCARRRRHRRQPRGPCGPVRPRQRRRGPAQGPLRIPDRSGATARSRRILHARLARPERSCVVPSTIPPTRPASIRPAVPAASSSTPFG